MVFRPMLMVALSLVLSLEFCGIKCGKNACGTHTVTNPNSTVSPGGTVSLQADCSTCSHSGGTITWDLLDSQTYTGTIDVTYRPSCPANALCCQGSSQSVAASAKTVKFEDINAKNLCGENDPISYTMTLTNNSNGRIGTTAYSITCPTNSSTSSASPGVLAPSPVGR